MSDAGLQKYYIERGDTIFSIAFKFNVSVQEIMAVNKFYCPFLAVGQKLWIPMKQGVEEDNKPAAGMRLGEYKAVTAYTATRPIYVNGTDINTGTYPVLNFKPQGAQAPYIYVPIAEFRRVGANVQWDDAKQTMTVTSDYDQLKTEVEMLRRDYKTVGENLGKLARKVRYINDFSLKAYNGELFELPKTVKAISCDGSNIEVPVTWTPATVDLNTPGIYYYKGTVVDYYEKVTLTLVIGKRGNTSGNLLNSASFVEVGGWIFFRNPKQNNSLYKWNPTTKELKSVAIDMAMYLNVMDNWIYYTNQSDGNTIYRIKPDGSERTKLSSIPAGSLNIMDDWMYFMNYADEGKLYRMKIDGSNLIKLSNDSVGRPVVIGEWVYYTNYSDKQYPYTMKTDGTARTKLLSEVGIVVNAVGDWVYYYLPTSALKGISKIQKGSTTKILITNDPAGDPNMVNNWIYYSNSADQNNLYRIMIDGTNRKRLNNEWAQNTNIYGDWIYYYKTAQAPNVYRIKSDGSVKEQIV